MRSLRLLALVAALLVLTSVASPWVTWALAARWRHRLTFSRVYNRVFEILLVLALPLVWRRLDLGTPAAIGFRRARWTRALGRGAGIGVAGIASALLVCVALGAVQPALRFAPGKTAGKAALGATAAALVGVGEEALFRGVVLRRVTTDFGVVTGIAATTAIYAAVHAIGKPPKEADAIDAWSGFRRTVALFAPLARADAVPSLIGLALLGFLLAVARLRAGTLWLPIGIHASWVAVFRVGRLFFDVRSTPVWLVGPGWPPLIGGAAGWLGVAVTTLLLLLSASSRRLQR